MTQALSSALLLTEGKQDAKSLVVDVLAREFPLSVKQIHAHIVNDNTRAKLTYQGVYKAVQELSLQGIITGDLTGYSLRKKWLDERRSWLDKTLSRYSETSSPHFSDLPSGSLITHTFPNVISVPYWYIEEVPSIATAKDTLVTQWFFGWPAQMVSEEQHRNVKKFANVAEKYALCRGNSQSDVYCLRYLEEVIGFKWKAGVNVANDCDTLAFQDFVVNIYWPTSFKALVTAAFSSPSLPAAMKQVYDYVFYGEGAALRVPVVIMRDKTIASQIIEESLAAFENELRCGSVESFGSPL